VSVAFCDDLSLGRFVDLLHFVMMFETAAWRRRRFGVCLTFCEHFPFLVFCFAASSSSSSSSSSPGGELHLKSP
jgi:hypothetical protein